MINLYSFYTKQRPGRNIIIQRYGKTTRVDRSYSQTLLCTKLLGRKPFCLFKVMYL